MGPAHSSGARIHFWEKGKQLLSNGKCLCTLQTSSTPKCSSTLIPSSSGHRPSCSCMQPGDFHLHTSPSVVSHSSFTMWVTSRASPGSPGAPISLVCSSYVTMRYPQRRSHTRWVLPLKALTFAKCNVPSIKILHSFSSR